MRRRPSSRLLLLDPCGRILLFRFAFAKGALSGQAYWATPGGGVKADETFEQAALRELKEETGIIVDTVGPEVANREFRLQLPNGAFVMADEHFFMVRTADRAISKNGWSKHEREVMTTHHWWSPDELARTSETVFPEGLLEFISAI